MSTTKGILMEYVPDLPSYTMPVPVAATLPTTDHLRSQIVDFCRHHGWSTWDQSRVTPMHKGAGVTWLLARILTPYSNQLRPSERFLIEVYLVEQGLAPGRDTYHLAVRSQPVAGSSDPRATLLPEELFKPLFELYLHFADQ